MLNAEVIGMIERLLKQHQRGMWTSREVVDVALGSLAFKAQFELVEPTVRPLMEKFADEVIEWVAFAEGEPSKNPYPHWVPYQDSRLVSKFYGGIGGGPFTAEQHQNFVRQMRLNVQETVKLVRAILTSSREVE